ncbi:hypothetical protein [Bacillus sp. NPDC094106]
MERQLWLCTKVLNIQYGNGVLVVVRDGESPLHGEGGQFTTYKQ